VWLCGTCVCDFVASLVVSFAPSWRETNHLCRYSPFRACVRVCVCLCTCAWSNNFWMPDINFFLRDIFLGRKWNHRAWSECVRMCVWFSISVLHFGVTTECNIGICTIIPQRPRSVFCFLSLFFFWRTNVLCNTSVPRSGGWTRFLLS